MGNHHDRDASRTFTQALPEARTHGNSGRVMSANAAPRSHRPLSSASSPSFFSLARSTGYAAMTAGEPAAPPCAAVPHDNNATAARRHSCDQPCASPPAHPPVPRPRLSVSQRALGAPATSGAVGGFTTISTRGPQRHDHHPAFGGDSPPPPPPQRRVSVSANGQSAVAASNPTALTRTDHGDPHSHAPEAPFSAVSAAASSATMNNSPGGAPESAAAAAAATTTASHSASNGPSRARAALDKAYAMQQHPPLKGSVAVERSPNGTTASSSAGPQDTSSAASSSAGGDQHHRRLQRHHDPQQPQPQPHRYLDVNGHLSANGDAVQEVDTPPSKPHAAPRASAPEATRSSSSSSSTATGTRTKQSRLPAHLSVDRLARHAADAAVAEARRRVSVSAAPFVPSTWRAPVRGHTSASESAKADAAAASTTVAHAAAEAASRSPVKTPTRFSFTVPDNHVGTLKSAARPEDVSGTSSAGKGLHAAMPAVRFIFTRSASTTVKPHSPERPRALSVVAVGTGAAAMGNSSNTSSTAHAPAASTASRPSLTATRVVGEAGSALGCRAAPALHKDSGNSASESRRASASVPFSRSSTYAHTRTRDTSHATADETAEARSRSRRASDSTTGASPSAAAAVVDDDRPGRASRRGSVRAHATRDFDAAPQSYLQRWRQRQEEKQRKMEEAAVDAAMPARPEEAARTTKSPPTIASAAEEQAGVEAAGPQQPVDPVDGTPQESQPTGVEPPTTVVGEEVSPPTVAADAPTEPAPERPTQTAEAHESAVAEHSVSSLRDVVESGAVPETAAAALAAAVSLRSLNASSSSVLALPQHPPPPQLASPTAADTAATSASDAASHSRATQPSRLAASTSFASSYLTEDVARPEAAAEDIPLDQLAPSAAPAASAATTREPASEAVSPPPQPAVETLPRPRATPQCGSAASSAHPSGRRRSPTHLPQLQPQPSGTAADDDQPPALATRSPSTTIPTSDEVRELCRAVLERREQRLQRQESLGTTGCLSPPQPRLTTATPGATSTTGAPTDVVKGSTGSSSQLNPQPNAEETGNVRTPAWTTATTMLSRSPDEVALPTPFPSRRSSASASRAITPAPLGSVRHHAVVSPGSDGSAGDREAAHGSSATPVVAAAGEAGTRVTEAHVEPVLLPSAYHVRERQRSTLLADAAATASEPAPVDASKSTSSDERDDAAAPSEQTPGRPSAGYTALLQSIRHSRSAASSATSGVPTPLPAAVDLEAGLAAVPTAAEIEQRAQREKRQALLAKYRRSSAVASSNERDEERNDTPQEGSDEPLDGATATADPKLSSSKGCSDRSSARKAEGSHRSSSHHSSSVDDVRESGAGSAPPAVVPNPPEQAAAAPAPPPPPSSTSAPVTPVGQELKPMTGARTPGSALAHIRADDLDLLEQSVNALLRSYGGPSTSATTAGEKSGTGGPPKLTAAAALLRDMPPPAKTSTTTTAAAAAAAKAQHVKNAAHDDRGRHSSTADGHLHGPSRSPGRLSDAAADEEDESGSLWAASGLWCGDEAAYEAPPLPSCVPPLDLTTLLLPTGEPEDLQPYRIPLPSAVAAPDEAYRRLLRAIGAYPDVGRDADGEAENDGGDGSTPGASPHTGRAHHSDAQSASASATGDDAASSSLYSSHASLRLPHDPAARRLSKSGTSITDVSPFVNERIQRMRAARQSTAATAGTAATVVNSRRRTSVSDAAAAAADGAGGGEGSRRGSRAARAGTTGSEEAAESGKQNAARSAAPVDRAIAPTPTTDDEAEDGISPSVGDATGSRRTAARRVLFTDDSDALDGGRGADRDRHVGRQRNRVQRVLLDCQEQRARKEILAQEANTVEVLSKQFYARRR